MAVKIFNGFAGLGGNSMLWQEHQVIAVEENEKIAAVYKKLHPDHEVIVDDAYKYFKNNHEQFDFAWFSPPCQKHSRMMKATRHKVADYPDFRLYELIVFLENFYKGGWIVENVVPYYKPLIQPTKKVGRHLFWASFDIYAEEVKQPKGFITKSNLRGKQEMMDWLGMQFDEVIYYKGNHCPVQVLRNCVHPSVGKQILDSYQKGIVVQQQLFGAIA
ncbi:DNA cytosine methyltransferase [Acinetobacter rathckeae]|uniref:DNA cytosine methyltransferase n=1 Tax=Acinetobacter rathckeae TaxID=2605272 RepID=UPI0018A2A057|nr:DNA cytosine methyltransferase [Acinetobacter rathckeae]MBF7687714.1 DNA cytosine methyltransferase [Acinetobacter rathckeae]MBF7688063.1 DNA cytosine methyltransferase [Acinetobacter rathckeae]